MTHAYLLRKYLGRHKLRVAMMMLSVFAAFSIYGVFQSLLASLSGGVRLEGSERMLTMSRQSMTHPLPVAYFSRVAAVPAVEIVAHATWFGGYVGTQSTPVATYAVEPKSYLQVYSNVVLKPEQLAAWQGDRGSVLVGEYYANRHGWKVGDRITLGSNLWVRADRDQSWHFTVAGVFKDKDPEAETNAILLHYDALNEARAFARDTIGWLVFLHRKDYTPDAAAAAVDQVFRNSADETRTILERAFLETFIEQLGEVGAIVAAVLSAAFIMVLMVTANTFAVAIRERVREVAVMRAIGFRRRRIYALLFAEALLIIVIPGVVGLGLAAFILSGMGEIVGFLGPARMGLTTITGAIAIMLALAGLVSVLPAWQIGRMRIVDALSRA